MHIYAVDHLLAIQLTAASRFSNTWMTIRKPKAMHDDADCDFIHGLFAELALYNEGLGDSHLALPAIQKMRNNFL